MAVHQTRSIHWRTWWWEISARGPTSSLPWNILSHLPHLEQNLSWPGNFQGLPLWRGEEDRGEERGWEEIGREVRGGEGRGGKRDQKNIYEGQIKAFVCCVGVGHVGVGHMPVPRCRYLAPFQHQNTCFDTNCLTCLTLRAARLFFLPSLEKKSTGKGMYTISIWCLPLSFKKN